MNRINKVHNLILLCAALLLAHPAPFSENLVGSPVRTSISGRQGRIAYIAAQSAGKEDIYVINADGSQQRKVADRKNFGFNGSLSWSSDGTQLAFSTYNDGYQICILNVDSSLQRCLPNSRIDEFSPMWLPDGHHIAFISEVIPGGERKLYVMDDQGHQRHEIGTFVGLPEWSPSGTQVVFESGYDIYTMNADGSNRQRLTDNPLYDLSPTWSPDGKQIAFVSEREDDREIYIMSADGSDQHRISSDSTYTFAPR